MKTPLAPPGKIIRPGQRKPFSKCTNEEMTERIEFVAELYTAKPLIRRSQVNKLVNEQFGIGFRQCADYIARAKKLLRARSTVPKEEVKDVVVNALLRVLGTGKNVVQAATALSDIYGLFAPKKTEISGPEGGRIELEHKTEKPIDFKRMEGLAQSLFGIPAADGNGESLHSADAGAEASPLPESHRP